MQNELIELRQAINDLREELSHQQLSIEAIKRFFEQAIEAQDLRIRNLRNEQ